MTRPDLWDLQSSDETQEGQGHLQRLLESLQLVLLLGRGRVHHAGHVYLAALCCYAADAWR